MLLTPKNGLWGKYVGFRPDEQRIIVLRNTKWDTMVDFGGNG